MTFSEKLRLAREKTGFTQEKLARKSGLSLGTIQQYELGSRNPKAASLAKIAAALNLGYGYDKQGEPYFYDFVDTVDTPESWFDRDNGSTPIHGDEYTEEELEEIKSTTIGELIKTERLKKGLSQAQLAAKCGVSQTAVWAWEVNKQKPKFMQFMRVYEALNFNLENITVVDADKDLIEGLKIFVPPQKEDKKTKLTEAMKIIRRISSIYKDIGIPLNYEVLILEMYWLLTEEGKMKAINYLKDLNSIPEYQSNIEEWEILKRIYAALF